MQFQFLFTGRSLFIHRTFTTGVRVGIIGFHVIVGENCNRRKLRAIIREPLIKSL